MVYLQTKLVVCDNSGAWKVRCIKNITGNSIGNLILVSIISFRNKNKLKLKKGSVVVGFIIKSKNYFKKHGSISTINGSNGVVLLNKQLQPFASRMFGIIPKNLRFSKFLKILILSGNLI